MKKEENGFKNKVHIALPMKSKPETRRFYEEVLGMRTIDFSPSELMVDFFDQHIAFHEVLNFKKIQSPDIMVKSPEEGAPDIIAHSAHFGACISAKDYKAMEIRILNNEEVEVTFGPKIYDHGNGIEEYIVHFQDCNGTPLEFKAISNDSYSLDSLADWSHKTTHNY